MSRFRRVRRHRRRRNPETSEAVTSGGSSGMIGAVVAVGAAFGIGWWLGRSGPPVAGAPIYGAVPAQPMAPQLPAPVVATPAPPAAPPGPPATTLSPSIVINPSLIPPLPGGTPPPATGGLGAAPGTVTLASAGAVGMSGRSSRGMGMKR
jgi:hypothetical protein